MLEYYIENLKCDLDLITELTEYSLGGNLFLSAQY